MQITLPHPREILRTGYVSTLVNGRQWKGYFGIPLEGGAMAAHPFSPEDRKIMPTVVFNQEMADRVKRDGEGWVFSL